jgi:hypothetical protein
MGIRKLINGILQLGAESTATTQATAVIQSTSGSLALVPSGSGAITAAIPDGTTVGGNARGSYTVDLQMSRTAANQVASSQFGFIGGGENNRINGSFGAIVAGSGNTIPLGGSQYIFIGGGIGNQSSGYASSVLSGESNNSSGGRAVISGGASNTNSSAYGTISGGQSNTASSGTHATVVGGQLNTASGQHSVVGGFNNTASGGMSVALNFTNVASGLYSVALGSNNTSNGTISTTIGAQNIASGFTSIALNVQSNAYLYSQQSNASGQFTANGDAQQSLLTARRSASLTTGATSSLSLDGTGTTNLIIPNGANRTWNTTVNWVATVTGSSGTTTGVSVGNSIYGVSEFGFKVSASIASITPLIRDSIVADTTIMETATLTYATGSSNSLAMTFTAPTFAGGGSLGMRVVAKVSLVELAW